MDTILSPNTLALFSSNKSEPDPPSELTKHPKGHKTDIFQGIKRETAASTSSV